jgi:hypothetical protein
MDPFVAAENNIGADFAALMVFNASVTVTQIDPDTGAALATATGVPALKRVRRRQETNVGGGELGEDTCRFVVQASAVGFTPKARDQIQEAAGLVWIVTGAELIAFGQLVVMNCQLKR